ncbi:hypothetical protein BU16DRAFT_558448 [Lophium mytilinum]|uniref:Uncharacterized protein n=1 Tax=Lophium mytilinum TaxID=390894 RepID=A0A6A6R100_9PEZI|nr:hypothetical protein BU16DRAFT_558448 [Lophium mytilinum]
MPARRDPQSHRTLPSPASRARFGSAIANPLSDHTASQHGQRRLPPALRPPPRLETGRPPHAARAVSACWPDAVHGNSVLSPSRPVDDAEKPFYTSRPEASTSRSSGILAGSTLWSLDIRNSSGCSPSPRWTLRHPLNCNALLHHPRRWMSYEKHVHRCGERESIWRRSTANASLGLQPSGAPSPTNLSLVTSPCATMPTRSSSRPQTLADDMDSP